MSETVLFVCVIVFLVCAVAGSRLLHEGLGYKKQANIQPQIYAEEIQNKYYLELRQSGAAIKREEIIICDSCHYSTDIYNFSGICDRCLRAKSYWGNAEELSNGV